MKAIFFCLALFATSLANAKQVPLDLDKSQLNWIGEKKLPGAGDHNGLVKIKKGTVNLNEKMELIGGTIVIDMTSIENKDLSGKYKTKLEQHLNSEDFFHVEKHPEAQFKITKAEKMGPGAYRVTGNMTLRGQTNTETFTIKVETQGKAKQKYLMATGDLELDRTKYGVTYNSEASVLKKAIKIAKDKVIKDKIKISLELKSEDI
jgi:polyisoprenoid-binding protein YceI